MITLAIDGMGGDHAPLACIEGMALFARKQPEVRFVLYGDESLCMPLVKAQHVLTDRCDVVHVSVDDCIKGDTKPSIALRQFPRSSMRLALESVVSKETKGAVSAGNTGAYLALSKMLLKTVCGIDRPAITSLFPAVDRNIVMLDLGGTIDVSSDNLVEYAYMGSIFAEKILKLQQPSIGLLNVGKEENKGSDTLQQAHAILRDSSLNYHGFIEGHDLALGTVSVVVTDGFTGNVALKTAEGMVHMACSLACEVFPDTWKGRLARWLALPYVKQLRDVKFNPRLYDGALWLGLSGVAVKSHGGTNAVGFATAIEMAYSMAVADVVVDIERALREKTITT